MRFFCLLILLTGCSSTYVSVFKQKVDRGDLASTHIGSPDPRQAHPPFGQMLTIDWKIPKSVLSKHPQIVLDVIYWNQTHETFSFPIESLMGYTCYRLLNEEYDTKKGLLTYRAQVVTEDGHVYKEWKHQLWVHWIEEDPNL